MSAPKMELRRAPEEEPTEAGWHYVKYYLDPEGHDPYPREVIDVSGRGLMVNGKSYMYYLSDYQFFGPVPICKESGT